MNAFTGFFVVENIGIKSYIGVMFKTTQTAPPEHSGKSRHPAYRPMFWIPAFAGMPVEKTKPRERTIEGARKKTFESAERTDKNAANELLNFCRKACG